MYVNVYMHIYIHMENGVRRGHDDDVTWWRERERVSFPLSHTHTYRL